MRKFFLIFLLTCPFSRHPPGRYPYATQRPEPVEALHRVEVSWGGHLMAQAGASQPRRQAKRRVRGRHGVTVISVMLGAKPCGLGPFLHS